MNYTTNYHLPQWVETDRIQMEDFNQMCADIDQGIKDAQETANTAQGTATAAYCPTNKPYVVGTYTGTSSNMTITLGFKPSFLIISGRQTSYPTGASSMCTYELLTAGNVLTECVTLTDTGFVLYLLADNVYPKLVERRTYDYIAFR